MLLDDLFEINRKVILNLWHLANAKSCLCGASRLIFPQRRDGNIRISEQESRVLYCELLNTSNYYYSIEAPTQCVYQQSGENKLSANSDLSLYHFDAKEFKKVANVEFKSHNPKKGDIRKDIEKLIKEGIVGNWFHTLKNVDRGTLPSLFGKFISSLKDCSSFIEVNGNISILFCFCVLEKKWGCIKHLSYRPSEESFEDFMERFFYLDYTIESGKIVVIDENGWSLISIACDV